MKTFSVKIKHDSGTARIMVTAYSKEAATEIVKKVEKCPDSAIISVRERMPLKKA